jgi:hypothetical protein
MKRIRLEPEFHVTWSDGETPDLTELLDKVWLHLVQSLGVMGLTMSSEGEDKFSLSMMLDLEESEELEQALLRAMATIRTACHAEGASTPGWEASLAFCSFQPLPKPALCNA